MDLIMTMDMTYLEIKEIKSNIKQFLDEIQKLAEIQQYEFAQKDRDFFSFIAKHIIFFKYLYKGAQDVYFYKVLISDLYYFILSIIKREMRYMYVNERSIIENYMRAIMQISLQDDHITEAIFQEMRNKIFLCDFTDAEYSLIKNEYVTSCEYIHGGNILNDNLAYVLDECVNNDFEIKDRSKYYIRVQNVFKIFDKLIVAEKTLYISGCFHRKKSVMEYLLGEHQVELLFNILNT